MPIAPTAPAAPASASQAPANKLTPTLSQAQLMQNIDALQKGGMATSDVQNYVNNYTKANDGSYALKSAQAPVQAPAPQPAPQENMGQMDADQLNEAGSKITSSISTAGQRINQDANGTIGGETKAVGDTLEGLAGAGAGAIQGVFAPVTASIQKIEQLASNNKGMQDVATSAPVSAALDTINSHVAKVGDWLDKNLTPRQQEDLTNAITIGTTAAGGEGGLLPGGEMSVGDAASTLKNVGSDAVDAAKIGAQAIKTGAQATMKDIGSTGEENPLGNIRANIATGKVPLMGENVPSTVQTSAQRLAKTMPLQGAGAARLANPLDTYNQYAGPEEAMLGNKAKGILGDAKLPGAAGKLGNYVTKGFEKVIQLRRSAGEAMGTALKGVADNPTDITKPTQNFVQHLVDDFNVQYDPKTQKVTPINGKQTSFTSSDQKMIGDYLGELQKLRGNPTVGDLDSFMKRVPNELDVAKAAKNITKVTPAEAAIKGHLSSLRGELDAKIDPKTGVAQKPELTDYTKAKKDYARLSGIVERGTPLLGGKDSEGNYIRDAAVAKRAVQSISDGGTKNLLLDIEHETGMPLMDHAVLALQAMKDAGNPMGHSLLEGLTNGGKDIPMNPQGFWEHLIKGGASYAKNKFVGSPAEQTRAFLKTLKRKE